MFRDQEELGLLSESYEEYDIRLRKQRLKIGLCLAIAFSMLFGGLDFVYYPKDAMKLISIRLSVEVFLVAFFVFAYFEKIKNIKFAGIVWALSLFIFIDVLIFLTEGAVSPYYAGLNLTVVALSVVMPWSFLETLFICFCLLFFYVITIVYHQISTGLDYNIQILISNIFFMLGTSIICVTASYFNSKQRFKEFCLNYELEENNKKLAALDEMKSQFFANVSHEFRTPLTLILGPIQDILHGSLKLPDKVASILDIIQQNALRLLKLVNDLLDVTKLEEGKFDIRLEKVEANRVVGGLSNSMMHMAASKDIEIVMEIAQGDLFIGADIDAMEKIIMNLLNNSIKFTGNGGQITVLTRKEFYDFVPEGSKESVKKENVVIVIKDNGIGMDKESLPHIFDRFKQVDSSSTRKYQGTGLGLALVKELTELQGGKVKVDSDIGQGTSFELTFPAFEESMLMKDTEEQIPAITQNEYDSPSRHSEAAAEDSITNIHKMAAKARKVTHDDIDFEEMITPTFDKTAKTVLVADDEPDMRYYVTSILKEEGYNLVQAKNGRTALEMVEKYKPDLVVLDLMMPEIDGLTVCDRLKKDEETKAIKVIMLTARSDESSKLQALKNGVDDFLNKPFGSIEIKSRIANLLQNSDLQMQLHHKNESLNDALTNLKETQSKLVHSEKINAIGNLAAGLLHEVNNPLSYSMTAVQLVKMDPAVAGDEDLKDTVKDIEEGMGRIKHIVSDLRAFAYPEEADKKIVFSVFKAVESVMRFTANECRDLEKIINIDEKLMAAGSQTHIVQVLINLVSNASKAVAKAGRDKGTLVIDAVEENGRIKISVTDNGTGMDEETVNSVFNPFFTTNDVGSGMGLGLSVSYTIIQNHGGTLAATSEFGKGSTFYFDIEKAV